MSDERTIPLDRQPAERKPELDLRRVLIPRDLLLVRELLPEETTTGGLFLPDLAQRKRSAAQVVQLGPSALKTLQVELEVGDHVIVSLLAMTQAPAEELGDPQLRILKAGDVLAVLKAE